MTTGSQTTAPHPGQDTDPVGRAAHLTGSGLEVGYEHRTVIASLDVAIPDRSFTVIIGPNGCGKSTLLRTLARLLSPTKGGVALDGRAISEIPTKELARTIGLLPQSPLAPEGITVADLVSRGRHPYQGLLKRWSTEDERAVAGALESTHMAEFAERCVDELSGGQRQRAWIAMALAQETPLLLLDEPTTYLDIAHQLDVLNLCARLQQEGRTLVAVLHDLNLALRYATHVIAMKDGAIIAEGSPERVGTAQTIKDVFAIDAQIIPDPQTGKPLVVPATSESVQQGEL